MLPFILSAAISMQCFVDSLEVASRVEITRPFKMNVYSKPVRNRRFLEKLYRLALKKSKGGDLDVRYFALAWMESRLRQFPRIGDRGGLAGSIRFMLVILTLFSEEGKEVFGVG